MSWEIRDGDVLDVLRSMPDGSVHCCVTSPPYWGLRDYGTAEWEGGDGGCDHQEVRGGVGAASAKQITSAGASTTYQYRDVCAKCGAKRIDNQLGLEPTPEEYVGKMVEVFREVRRVLRDDGTLWLNLGDSYNGVGRGTKANGLQVAARATKQRTVSELKSKDLVGIPWRVAFALQADGWWLRSDIIWAKPNPMPESVRDRPTKAHEYVFLLSKSERYFYDADAVAEDSVIGAGADSSRNDGDRFGVVNDGTRNRRTVWEITTKPFAEAHFATFPPDLPEICIKAGTPKGGTVLDPFSGAGTTGMVALRLGRSYIGIELNPEYAEMSRRRIDGDCPLFNRDAEVDG